MSMLCFLMFVICFDRSKLRKLTLSFIFSVFVILCYYPVIFNFSQCTVCVEKLRFSGTDINLDYLSILYLILNENVTKSVFFGCIIKSDIVLKRFPNELPGNDMFQNIVICPAESKFKLILDTNICCNLENVVNEAVLLQVVSADEGWPVPHLLGCCGDFFIEDYKGRRLAEYSTLPFISRVYLAHQLLKLAHNFTFQHETFAFYLTDLSPDNIVIDSSGLMFIVDLDNVVIVDKNRSYSESSAKWLSIHKSDPVSDREFDFSTDDICQHKISDHNYYSVCQHLLKYSEVMPEGLLQNIPDFELSFRLKTLLNECSKPKMYKNRIEPGRELEAELEAMLEGYAWEEAKFY